MEREIAEKLFGELSKHLGLPSPTERFIDVLVSVETKDSSRFYKEVPQVIQNFDEYGRSHQFSIRRILRNKNAILTPVSNLKMTWRNIVSKIGARDSNIFARDVREREELVDMMFSSLNEGYEFSLLGKLNECDYEVPPTKYKCRPILIIQIGRAHV